MSNPWSSVMPGGVPFSRQPEDETEETDEVTWGDEPDDGPDDRPDDGPGAAGDGTTTDPVSDAASAEPDVSTDVDISDGRDGASVGGEVEEGEGAQTGLPTAPLPTAPLPVAAPTTVAPAPVAATSLPVTPPAPTSGVTGAATGAATGGLPTSPSLPVIPSTPAPQAEEDGKGESWFDDDDDDVPAPGNRLAFLPGSPLAPLTPPNTPTTAAPVAPTAPAAPAADEPQEESPAGPQVGDEVEVDGVLVNTTTGEIISPTPVVAPAPVAPILTLPTVPTVPRVSLVPVPSTPVAVPDVGLDWDPDDLLDDNSEEAENDRKETKALQRKARAKRKPQQIALTERDREMFTFLARYRFATYPQLARYFQTTPVSLRQRLPRLAKEGLLVRMESTTAHGVWLPTDSALRAVNMDLPTPTRSWATINHTLGLVDIGIKYELDGESVVTEREIRAADTRDRPSPRMRSAMLAAGMNPDEPVEEGAARLYVVNLGSGESHYGHIPDMILARPANPDGSAASVAIELELNSKPPTQWRKILRAYRNATNIGQVIYYVTERQLASGITKAAKEVEADHKVVVRKFLPSESTDIRPSKQSDSA